MSRRATRSRFPVMSGALVYFYPAFAQQFPPGSQLFDHPTTLSYESGGGSPAECCAGHLATLLRILGSARTASYAIHGIRQRARRSQQVALVIWWDTTQTQECARGWMRHTWTETLRGTPTGRKRGPYRAHPRRCDADASLNRSSHL